MKKLFKIIVIILLVVLAYNLLSIRKIPKSIDYGVSFSVFHSNELKLDWKKTFEAILDDLKVRNFRFSLHWPLTEPEEGKYNFSEMDYQIEEADERNASYILAVGRRLPGWPECHIPDWARSMNEEQQKEKILALIENVVMRYKDSLGLKYWQVENEPFLGFFGRSHCVEPDENFLRKEIDLVRKLDPDHPILITDSGEFGTWYKAYRNSDVFGSSLYIYVWWRSLGEYGKIRYPIGSSFFRIKQNIVNWIWGEKPTILIEMEAEPWLLEPIIDAPSADLTERMGLDKFKEIIELSKESGFSQQYLWGAEWWYWMKENGHPEHWDEAMKLFKRE